MIGQTFSHYRITAALGAGGMGEVYRATDSHLEREVAIKVLPAEVAESPERLSRFKREARLLAALNHPNIAAIYGLEEADGKPFLALELVEGEDLKERLQRGPIPVPEALEIAVQIAEALEEAHGKGIVHRDLKPANVKITPDGKVKVLDFGLAKAWGGDPSEGGFGASSLSLSPTIAHTETAIGVILGTAAYMSPEQARGKPVDKRADVWSFGVVLWEMLTSQSLFAGETVTDVLAAVVRKQPDLKTLPQSTPPAIRLLLERCLRKDPRTRLPDIGAARLELQDVMAGVSHSFQDQQGSSETTSKSGRPQSWGQLIWALIAIVAAVIAGALGYLQMTALEPPQPMVRFSVDPPAGSTFTEFDLPAPSPDGRHVVLSATSEDTGKVMLWVRSLDSLAARPLSGTEGENALQAFWSRDSRFLGFPFGEELRKINLADGSVQRVCTLPAPEFFGGTWSEDGTIYFGAGQGGPRNLYSVPATGGEPKLVVAPDQEKGEQGFAFPQFLEDRNEISFLILGSGENIPGIYTFSPDSPETKRLIAPGTRTLRIVGDNVLFSTGNALLAQKLHAAQDQVLRDGTTIASSLNFWAINPAFGFFETSSSGTVAFYTGEAETGDVQLVWLDRNGGQVGKTGEPGSFGQITLSPDERSIAVEVSDTQGQFDLWVMDVSRGVPSRVTATSGDERDPVWAPDSGSLAFVARRDGIADLRIKGLRAGAPETVLLDSPEEDIPENWTRENQTILVVRRTSQDEQSVWAVSATGEFEAEPIVTGAFRIDEPQLSPDGQWLAYVSDESGQEDVYLESFRREGQRVRISVDGGGQPKWRSDGKELFFVSLDNRLMAVDVKGTDRLEVGLPTELFEMPTIQGPGYDDYAPSANGQSFLVKRPIQESRRRQLQIVTNWPTLLN
ncbi:MAG: serine/threonine-protein kinase [Acidobacteriota bacterium]|nr:MAG: serine/threonine-protein kinase [Acidobacteriota bacterium]